MDVQQVIARLRAEGDRGRGWFEAHEKPVPLGADELAASTRTYSGSAPEELFTWLGYDATWFTLLDGTDRSRLATTSLRDLLARWAEGDAYGADGAAREASKTQVFDAWLALLPSPSVADAIVIELPMSGSQEHLLVLQPGATARVLGFHQRYEFWWKYESFGEFLGHYFGFATRD